MKSYSLICFFLAVAMILLPLFAVEKAPDVISRELLGEEAEYEEPVSEVKHATVKVMNASSENITEMSLEEYLTGVVAAEMNPAYHEEALKAQIIASHTLLLYVKENRSDDLNGADISDSSASHQAFLSEDERKEKWGKNYEAYSKKTEKCVNEVIDLTIQYNGEYINAVFHAISNGKTENAGDVWGGNYPYLVSVQSVGDKLSPAYHSEVTVTEKEFCEKLDKYGIDFSNDAEKWISDISLTDTGMVKSLKICGKEIKGTEIRSIFSLKSSTFDCKHSDGKFTFSVNGYGHGAGMSQYGADQMARQGFTYEEILKHYYTDVEIV